MRISVSKLRSIIKEELRRSSGRLHEIRVTRNYSHMNYSTDPATDEEVQIAADNLLSDRNTWNIHEEKFRDAAEYGPPTLEDIQFEENGYNELYDEEHPLRWYVEAGFRQEDFKKICDYIDKFNSTPLPK